MVEEDCGRELALKVARRLVVFLKRPGGQRQYSTELRAQLEEETLTGRLTAWLLPRLHKSVRVDDMAHAMSVSPRTLHRQIEKETSFTPAAWLRRLRLDAARRLLGNPELSIKQVARRSGFGDEYNLRRAFNRELGVAPSDYRARLA
jgi:transcriptional regulator GlxA family with amidase domain